MSKVQVQGRLGQQMAMTPQLLQSIRLLQLSSLELEQELRQALESNVMLEGDLDLAEDETPEQTEADAEHSDAELEVSGQDADAHAKVEADFDWSSAETWSGGEPPEEDGETWEARLPVAVVVDARVAALEQLRLMVSDERQSALVTAIVEAVDDNGYLEESLEDIAARSQLQPSAELPELEAALQLVQSVEPSGFAARNLSECLRLQLAQLPRSAARTLAGEIIEEHLSLLAAHDYATLGAALQVDALELHAALDLLLSLNPKPGSGLAAAAEAALPDLIVTGTPGAWKVELNAERLPRLRINRLYERTIANSSHRALRDQLQEARWLVRGLEMRHDTLLRTGRAIFERQQAFLERGEEGMAPLTLREVAERIGMHESTVCRVTTNKWVQTPWGVYELKAFFPSQIAGREGDTSGTAVKAMIRRIINAENRQAPLSDGQIGALLARQGVRIARRTVAKYREAMRIPAVKDRLPLANTARLPIAG